MRLSKNPEFFSLSPRKMISLSSLARLIRKMQTISSVGRSALDDDEIADVGGTAEPPVVAVPHDRRCCRADEKSEAFCRRFAARRNGVDTLSLLPSRVFLSPCSQGICETSWAGEPRNRNSNFQKRLELCYTSKFQQITEVEIFLGNSASIPKSSVLDTSWFSYLTLLIPLHLVNRS